MLRREEPYLIAITALCAILVAASGVGTVAGVAIWSVYAYWLVRLCIEAALFIAFREVIEKFGPSAKSPILVLVGAILLSLIPFVLAITAFDIVLGYPELDLRTEGTRNDTQLAAFGKELFYLLDNHLALCLLLSMPRFIGGLTSKSSETELAEPRAKPPSTSSFLANLSPPLDGEIIWAEAQEHYVRLVTTTESRLVLYRFSDILRELPASAGMRVHRSHWVALSAIAETAKKGANLQILLKSGETIPVSRSYRQNFEQALEASQHGPVD